MRQAVNKTVDSLYGQTNPLCLDVKTKSEHARNIDNERPVHAKLCVYRRSRLMKEVRPQTVTDV